MLGVGSVVYGASEAGGRWSQRPEEAGRLSAAFQRLEGDADVQLRVPGVLAGEFQP